MWGYTVSDVYCSLDTSLIGCSVSACSVYTDVRVSVYLGYLVSDDTVGIFTCFYLSFFRIIKQTLYVD